MDDGDNSAHSTLTETSSSCRAVQVSCPTNLDRAITAAQERGSDPLTERIDWYLSPEHRADIEHGCPNASCLQVY